jgi:hypothetical protein
VLAYVETAEKESTLEAGGRASKSAQMRTAGILRSLGYVQIPREE